jgi:diguanylate cyclase (GGDEF)-like protein
MIGETIHEVETHMTTPDAVAGIDFKTEGRRVDIKLLRALALGGKRSVEIQLLLDSEVQHDSSASYQKLAQVLAEMFVEEPRARATFEQLRIHQNRLKELLGRPAGIKTAALDYLENLERALNIRDDEQQLTYMQLTQIAFYDHLTGLANFRYFMRRFNEEIKRAERYRHLLSVLMLDLDLFKNFNDTHGHVAGNRALEHIGRLLRAHLRETDLVARYGGEEFAVLLPETTKYEAFNLAQNLRKNIEAKEVELPDEPSQRVTVSIGLATYPRDAQAAEALLKAADTALYASKHGGRNLVNVFTPGTSANFWFTPDNPAAAHSIHVVGDFNGWNKAVDPMQKGPDGKFSLVLQLAPGRYAYKFVVNGEWFIPDSQCTEFTHDGFGGRNSVLVVK